jgi:hypothetical protein
MSSGNRRQSVFIIGLISGLLLGSAFAIYLVNKSFFDFRKNREIFESLNPFDTKNKEVTDVEGPQIKTYSPSKYKIGEAIIPDTVYEIDSTDLELMGYIDPYTESELVKRDELLYAMDVVLKGNAPRGGKNIDSLLIDDKYSNNQDNIYRIEFWKSPINFVGYKLQGRKLVLFGIFEYRSIELLKTEGGLFLEYLDRHYRIEEHSDFAKLIPVKKP